MDGQSVCVDDPRYCYPRKVIRLQDVIFASLYAVFPAIDSQSSKLVDSWVQRYQVRYHNVIITLSLRYHYVIITLSLRHHYVIITLSLHHHYVIFALSLRHHYVIIT